MNNSRKHVLTREPAPIVDAWLAKCSCGWRKPVLFYEFATREAVFAEIDRLFADHVAAS